MFKNIQIKTDKTDFFTQKFFLYNFLFSSTFSWRQTMLITQDSLRYFASPIIDAKLKRKI